MTSRISLAHPRFGLLGLLGLSIVGGGGLARAAEPLPAPLFSPGTVTLEEARAELQNLDDLVDDADSRAVREEIHRKVTRLDALLVELERAPLAQCPSAAPAGEGVVSTPSAVSAASLISSPSGVSALSAASVSKDPLEALARSLSGAAAAMAVPGSLAPAAAPATAPPPTPPAQRGPPATPARMDELLYAIDQRGFPSAKQEVIRAAARTTWFNTAQVILVLQSFAFGSDQVEAAVTLYPRVTDPQRWEQVYSVFTFDSDRKALRAKVGA
jgi:hypothetical protein